MDYLATLWDGGWDLEIVSGAAAACIAAVAVLVAVASRRRIRRLEATVASLGLSVEQLGGAVRRQRDVQRALAAGLERSNERVGQIELRAASRPYEQAIRMAAEGGSEDGLRRYFGLTDGEAALVRLLHGEPARARPTRAPRAVPGSRTAPTRG